MTSESKISVSSLDGLRKSYGVLSCVSYIVQLMIGSGIFIMAKGILRETGSVGSSFLIWIACGIYSIFGALSYTELNCMMPKSGGEYEYFKIAFGDLFGFLFMLSVTFITNPAFAAINAFTFADYFLKIFFPTCQAPELARLLIAIEGIIALTIVNSFSVKISNYLGYFFNAGKTSGIGLIVSLGIYGLYMNQTQEFQEPFVGSSTNIANYGIAFVSGYFCTTCWQSLGYITGEIKNPSKTVPISIFLAITFVTIIYFLTNVAFFTFLSKNEVLESNVVAFTFLAKVNGSYSWFISICVALSTLGYVNGSLIQISRTIYVAAKNNHLPSLFGLVTLKYHTPIVSVMFSGFLITIFMFVDNMNTLLNMGIAVYIIAHVMAVLALFWLRKTQPNTPRPFKVNLFFPISFLIASFYVLFVIFCMYPTDFLLVILTYCFGTIGYFVFIKCPKPETFRNKII